MAETSKEEIKRLTNELRQTSQMTAAMSAAQSRLNSALTRNSDAISKSIMSTMQGIKSDADSIKLKNKSLELTRKKLEQAQRDFRLTEQSLQAKQEEVNVNRDRIRQLKNLGDRRTAAETTELQEKKDAHADLITELKESRSKHAKSAAAVDNFTAQIEIKTTEIKSLKFTRLADAVNGVSNVMNTLVQSVRTTQQQLGLSAGSAAKVGFGNLKASVQSFADALKTGGAAGPGVSMEQIATAQQDFQEQFGGVLTSEAATKMAQEAVRMGVTTQQLAEARRTFLTQTGGDAGKAQAQTDKFISEFAKKGLSSKTAMQEIAKNSELLAKNGIRFAGQMARALADAKKIGVDLSKISQFGDNLINDFEGFLEGQAELGAMGFNLDSSRLAEISETGSDADLFNELRSQLAATGKDITKLRRSERLALESQFGMSISEMQKLAGETPDGGGEDTLDPAELQKNANEKLGNMVNLTEAAGKALGVMGTALAMANILLGMIERNSRIGSLVGGRGLFRSRVGGAASTARSRMGAAATAVGSRMGAAATAVRSRVGTAATAVGRLIPTRIFNLFGNALEKITFPFTKLGEVIPSVLDKFKSFGTRLSALIPTRVFNLFGNALEKITFQFSRFGGFLSTTMTKLSTSGVGQAISRFGGAVKGVGGQALGKLGAGKGLLGKLGTGGVLSGLFGGVEGFMTAKKSGKGGYEAAGAATVQGGLAAAGAALGALGGPIGIMVGGFLGNTIGKAVNKYFPSLGANVGLLFKGMISAIEPLKKAFGGVWENIKKLGEPLSKIMNLFGGTTDKANNLWPILETVGNIMGTAILLPFNLLATTLGLASGGITALVQMLTGDFAGALETVKSTFSNSFAWITEPLMNAVDAVKGIFGSIIDWVYSKIPSWMGGPPKTAKKGDDVVSQPGYGKRSLVTPSGVIALNNKDNIIAYADDLDGTKKLPYGSIAKKAGEKASTYGPLLQSLFQKGTEAGAPTGGISALKHLAGVSTEKMGGQSMGLAKQAYTPRNISTLLGNVGKFSPKLLKFAAQNAKAIPVLGSLIGGGFSGYDEYKKSGSIGRGIGKGLFSAAGGTVGSIAAGGLTLGNPIAAAAGGIAGSMGGEMTFDAMMGPVTKADDFINGKKLPLGSISKLASKYGAKDKAKQFAENKAPSFMKYAPQAQNLFGSYKEGGTSGLKSNLMSTGMGFASSKVPGFAKYMPQAQNLFGSYKEGGTSGLKSTLMAKGAGLIGNKIPGLSGAMSAFSAYKEGGLKGVFGSLAKGGIGKGIGAAIGSAIPIPGVGTMLGSMVGSKLGKLVGGLFGKKKKEQAPTITPDMMKQPSTDLSTMLGSQTKQTESKQSDQPQRPVTVDTAGIEKQLSSFINALQNIQINLDGSKVGKVLVNTADASTSTGVFRAQSR